MYIMDCMWRKFFVVHRKYLLRLAASADLWQLSLLCLRVGEKYQWLGGGLVERTCDQDAIWGGSQWGRNALNATFSRRDEVGPKPLYGILPGTLELVAISQWYIYHDEVYSIRSQCRRGV